MQVAICNAGASFLLDVLTTSGSLVCNCELPRGNDSGNSINAGHRCRMFLVGTTAWEKANYFGSDNCLMDALDYVGYALYGLK